MRKDIRRSPINSKFNQHKSVDRGLDKQFGRTTSGIDEPATSPRHARDMWRAPDEIEEGDEEEDAVPYKFKVIAKDDVEIFETDFGSEEDKAEKVERE